MLMWPALIPADEEERERWLAQMIEEIPAFLAHCLTLAVPASLKETSPRFGHLAFQHPELMERLNAFSPERHLLGLIDQLMFRPDDPYKDQWEPWEGCSTSLRTKLIELANGRNSLEREISDLLKSAEMCGTYLGRLKLHRPERVAKPPRIGDSRLWRIKPPPKETETQ